MASPRKIYSTSEYRLFQRHSGENRPLDLKKHRKLFDSMKLYGFLPTFPIVVHKNGDSKYIVKDGQHRLAIAESLGLPVFFIESVVDFDVALVNSTAKTWQLRDYAQKYAANGKKDYAEGLEFVDRHKIPIGTAFGLLSGTTSFSNNIEAFLNGDFKVKDRSWADAVANIYVPMCTMSSSVRNARFIEACMAVCRVPDFNADRLLQNAERCREKLVSFSTRDAYLDMLETIYNFGRKQLVGLKAASIMAMRERNATVVAMKKKKAKPE